ncbi:MAG: PAS domain S-box protein, partial [Thermodesulfovibrionales bacterium]
MKEPDESADLAAHCREETPALKEQIKKLKELYPPDAGWLANELALHQIALEARNEELRSAREELAAELARRERMESALRKSEESYRTLFETAPDAVVIVDLNLHIVGKNSAAFSLFGYTRMEELEGKTILDFVVPGEHSRALQNIKEFREKGYIQNLEYTLMRKDGTLFPAWVRASLIRDPEGTARNIMMVVRDLSEMKRLEEQLIQSQKMEALGTLTGGIAHDFNNILTAIVGYSSLLQMKLEKDSPLASSVEGIIASSEKASFLTRQLLLFSKKGGMSAGPVDLNSIVRKAEHLLLRLLPHNIGLSFIPSPEELIVTADSTQIDQVLINLAVNARDAMPEGGSITFSTTVADMDDEFVRAHGFGTPGRYALLTVADSGKGMDDKTRERIFEPFFTTKERGKGTGLGLSVVYGIIKGHKGYIDVSSSPETGSTFRIYLPLT